MGSKKLDFSREEISNLSLSDIFKFNKYPPKKFRKYLQKKMSEIVTSKVSKNVDCDSPSPLISVFFTKKNMEYL